MKPRRGFKGLAEGSKGLTGCDGGMEEGGREVKGTFELVFAGCKASFLCNGDDL